MQKYGTNSFLFLLIYDVKDLKWSTSLCLQLGKHLLIFSLFRKPHQNFCSGFPFLIDNFFLVYMWFGTIFRITSGYLKVGTTFLKRVTYLNDFPEFVSDFREAIRNLRYFFNFLHKKAAKLWKPSALIYKKFWFNLYDPKDFFSWHCPFTYNCRRCICYVIECERSGVPQQRVVHLCHAHHVTHIYIMIYVICTIVHILWMRSGRVVRASGCQSLNP